MHTSWPRDIRRRILREPERERPPGPRGKVAPLAAALAALLVLPSPGRAAGELPAKVREAQKVVEEVRGLPFRGEVASAVIHEKELEPILARKLVEDLPVSFDAYAAALASIGLIEPSPELLARLTRLYARQVVGFYDPGEKRFFVVPERFGAAAGAAGETGDLLEESLLVHELTHALQDRRLGLKRRIDALKDDSDGLLALQALLEGEATVVMADALVARLPEDSRGLVSSDLVAETLQGLGTSDVEGADGVPEFFVKELLFPYASGTEWVRRRRDAGGWAAVDAAYGRLPATTSEILHPERYPWSRPLLPDRLRPGAADVPAGSDILFSDTLGEWALRFLLEEAGAGEDAADAAASWQDDRVVFFSPRSRPGWQVGFVWRIRCTSPASAQRLATLLPPLYSGRPLHARPTVKAFDSYVEVARGNARAASRPPR